VLSILFVDARNRTHLKYVCYVLYFYFSGLFLRKAAAMIDWILLMFYKKKLLCFYMEMMDSKIQTAIKYNVKEK